MNIRGRRARRRLGYAFDELYYKPRGVPLSAINEVKLTYGELEALRLRYVEGRKQVDAAKTMGISQSQFQRDLTGAISKITRAMLNGDAIQIQKSADKYESNYLSDSKKMKTVICMDSKDENQNVSDVFGRCKYFAIFEVGEDTDKGGDSDESGDSGIEFVENPGAAQSGGAGIAAAQKVVDLGAKKVVAGNIGPNAEAVLNQGGVEVEIVKDKSLEDVVKSF